SPLTIGSGGVSAYGSISLAASGSDNLTIAGNIASSYGNISLMAPGGSIAVSPGVSLSAPYGTITLNSVSTGTDALAVVGNNTATDYTVSSLLTAMGLITSDESGDDEDQRKKKNKEGGDQKTDEKKMDDDKKYCN
ncbi:MAG: hypothetical protein NT140_07760, partial [Deltaproteobacteria bacterium]|nr:hypothetical protein [Deltaproteobacteria bacterium]